MRRVAANNFLRMAQKLAFRKQLSSFRHVTKYFNPSSSPPSYLVYFSVLSEDATQTQSFEAIAASVHHYFQKQDHFKVGSAIVSTNLPYSF